MISFKRDGVELDKSVLVLGDLHGVWRKVNSLIASKKPEIVMQTGDFGWWPKFHKTTKISTNVHRIDPMYGIRKETGWNQYGLKPGKAKFYFTPGNHEDWEDLNLLATSDDPVPQEVMPNVFYMPRCATLTLPDGRRVLFIGGAKSTDKEYRRYRYDWYPEENITDRDIANLPAEKVDIVVSHTCPNEFKSEINLRLSSTDYRVRDSYWLEKWRDSSCQALSIVLEYYKPELWFFGHFHIAMTSYWKDTTWFALNKESSDGWWTYLPKRI